MIEARFDDLVVHDDSQSFVESCLLRDHLLGVIFVLMADYFRMVIFEN